MDHQQWLNWRRDGIGSSDAPVVMGVSPWKTPLQLWEEKLVGVKESADNFGTRRGKELEEPARKEFERMMNTIVFPKNATHPSHDYIRASLDGLDLDQKILVEIKCPNKDDHSAALNKKVPEKYYPQCQHQLFVTGLSGMYYFSFDGHQGTIVEVSRDYKYIKELFENERKFWTQVITGEPPKAEPRDFASMEGDSQWIEATTRWKEINAQLKEVEEMEKNFRQMIVNMSNGRNAKGNSVSAAKTVCRGAIDYNAAISSYINRLKEKHPSIELPEFSGEEYRKSSFSKWTLKAI